MSCSKERKVIDPNVVIDPDAKKLGYVGEDGKSKRPDYNSVLTIKQVADLSPTWHHSRRERTKRIDESSTLEQRR